MLQCVLQLSLVAEVPNIVMNSRGWPRKVRDVLHGTVLNRSAPRDLLPHGTSLCVSVITKVMCKRHIATSTVVPSVPSSLFELLFYSFVLLRAKIQFRFNISFTYTSKQRYEHPVSTVHVQYRYCTV